MQALVISAKQERFGFGVATAVQQLLMQGWVDEKESWPAMEAAN